MTPLERYQADLLREDFHADAAQEKAVRFTQHLFDALLAEGNMGNRTSSRNKSIRLEI